MSKLSELKAEAYDLLVSIEKLQLRLREVNTEIFEESKKDADKIQNIE